MALRTHSLVAAVALFTVGTVGKVARAAPQNRFSAAASIDSAYDDNVYNGRGPDFVNRVSPQVTYHLIASRVKLDAAYALGYWTYAFQKAENSLNHRASVALDANITRRLTLTLDDELTRAEDPGFIDRMGVVAPQIGITDNVTDAKIGYNFTRRWLGAASYTFHFAIFDPFTEAQVNQGLAPLYDGAEHDATAYAQYRVTRLDDLRMQMRYQHFSAGPQNVSISEFDLANTYSPTVGWRHQFLPVLELTADAGPLVYQALAGATEVPGAPRSTGVTWRADGQLRFFTPSWRASVAYTHDLLGATGAGTALWADYVRAQGGYHYATRLEINAGVGYFRNGPAIDQPFSYDGVTADATIDWRVIDNLRLGAYYTVRWQRTGPGAVPPGAQAAQFPDVVRDIVGIRLLAVVGADARPHHGEVHE